MSNTLRIPQKMLQSIRQDLIRPHAFAAERVGFISIRCAALPDDGLLLLAESYYPVADDHYMQNRAVGAMIGPVAIRKAMQIAFTNKSGMMHVHLHHHDGRPWFGKVDNRCNAELVPDFFNVSPSMAHGALVLSFDAAAGQCWRSKSGAPEALDEVVAVGAPTIFTFGDCV
jgi:hypothetical protein